MRKKILLYALFFSIPLVFVFLGCEKEKDKDEPIIIESLVEASITDYNPPYGGTSTLSWEVSNPFNYERIVVKNNNEILSTLSKGTETLDSIVQIQKITISCFKKGETEPSLEKKLNDIIPQDVIEPKLPSITLLLANPQTLPIGGGETIISWTSNENTLSVEYNGSTYPANGSLTVYVENDSTRLVFVAQGVNGQRASSILIRVEQTSPPPPQPTMEDTLCMFGGWWRAKLEFQSGPNPDDPWIEQEIWECSKDDVKTFYLTPNKIVYTYFGLIHCFEGEPEFTEDPWSLSGNIITISQVTREISVDENTLILISANPWLVRETFVHKNIREEYK